MEYGSLINHVAAPAANFSVGDGATIVGWSDRYAYTVIAVSPSGKTVTLQRDIAVRADCNGMSDAQNYDYIANPDGEVRVARLGKRGFTSQNQKVIPGRHEYYDYSF